MAARFCKQHAWRLLILHRLPSAPWVLALWAKDLVFLHFPCISGSGLGARQPVAAGLGLW